MEGFNTYYDQEEDILYLARKGEEEEVIELAPGVNLELDAKGELIGVELLKASELLKDAVVPMAERLKVA